MIVLRSSGLVLERLYRVEFMLVQSVLISVDLNYLSKWLVYRFLYLKIGSYC